MPTLHLFTEESGLIKVTAKKNDGSKMRVSEVADLASLAESRNAEVYINGEDSQSTSELQSLLREMAAEASEQGVTLFLSGAPVSGDTVIPEEGARITVAKEHKVQREFVLNFG